MKVLEIFTEEVVKTEKVKKIQVENASYKIVAFHGGYVIRELETYTHEKSAIDRAWSYCKHYGVDTKSSLELAIIEVRTLATHLYDEKAYDKLGDWLPGKTTLSKKCIWRSHVGTVLDTNRLTAEFVFTAFITDDSDQKISFVADFLHFNGFDEISDDTTFEDFGLVFWEKPIRSLEIYDRNASGFNFPSDDKATRVGKLSFRGKATFAKYRTMTNEQLLECVIETFDDANIRLDQNIPFSQRGKIYTGSPATTMVWTQTI